MSKIEEFVGWLNEETGGMADWELFLVKSAHLGTLATRAAKRVRDRGDPQGSGAIGFLAHGKDRATWDSRFSPRQKADPDKRTDEFPRLDSFSAAEVNQWLEFARRLQRPELRARFGDAAWELGERITGVRDPRLYVTAREAASAYLEIARHELGREVFAGVQAAARSVELAAQIGAKELLREGFDFFMAMAAAATPEHMGQWFAPFDRLMEQPGIDRNQRKKIVEALEARFWDAVAGGDLHRPKMAGQALAKYHRDRRNYAKAKELTLGYGEAIIRLCECEKPGVAAHHLAGVSDDYARLGLREDAERVRVLVEQRGRETLSEMQGHFVELELGMAEIELQLTETVDHESDFFALWRLAWRCTPVPSETAERRQAARDTFSIHSLIPTSIIGEAGLPVASVGTDD